MSLDRPFQPTETLVFNQGQVWLEVENSKEQFAWKLWVGKDFSGPTTHFQGLLECKGWIVATAFWVGVLPVMTPFRVTPAVPAPGIKP